MTNIQVKMQEGLNPLVYNLDAVNYLPLIWRGLQVKTFTGALRRNFDDFGNRIQDEFSIKVSEGYDPKIPNAYILIASIESKKFLSACIDWRPLRKRVNGLIFFVQPEYRGKGIGSELIDVTEDIGRDLNVERVEFFPIIEENLDYWKGKRDYQLNGNIATKILKL